MKFTFPPESRPLEGYTIKRAIHRGGFGEVYYALSDAGKEVALKLLQQHLEIELRGVKQCLNLKHPNLVTTFDIRTDADGDHWIVMEYISGRTLDRVLDDAPSGLPLAEVEEWVSGIVAGLSYLHDHGIVHRDLKPANIYRDHGVVKIGDVGLSKFISESRRSAQTESVGTVHYMAPEISRGNYGREVDVYALAVVTFEMLTGRVPFAGESTGEILMKHLTEKPDLTAIPERLRPVLARALAKDPMQRTPTAAEFESEFRRALHGVERPIEIPQSSFVDAAAEAQPAAADAHASALAGGANPRAHWSPRDIKRQARYAREAAYKAGRELRKAAKHALRAERKRQKALAKAAKAAARADRRAAQMGGEPLKHARPAGSPGESSGSGFWWKSAVAAVIALAIFAPETLGEILPPVFTLGILIALAYGSYRIFGLLLGSADDDRVATRSAMAAPAMPVSYRARLLSPETRREIPLRTRTAEWTTAMAAAVPIAALITAAVALLTTLLRDPAQVALFGFATLLSSWTVLTVSKFQEGSSSSPLHRRMMLLCGGLAVGAAVFQLEQALYVDLGGGTLAQGVSAPLAEIGALELTHPSGHPTLVGFAVYFAALFGSRRWWWHADSFRKDQFRIGTVLLTVLAGWVWAMLLDFPVLWGTTLAAAVSSVVQLSATWVPLEQRIALVESDAKLSA